MKELRDRIESLETENQKLLFMCDVKQEFNENFREIIDHLRETRKKKEEEFNQLKEQFDCLVEEYASLSNKYDELKMIMIIK